MSRYRRTLRRVELVHLEAGRLRRRRAVGLAGQGGAEPEDPPVAGGRVPAQDAVRVDRARSRRAPGPGRSPGRRGGVAVEGVVVGRGGEAGLDLGLVDAAAGAERELRDEELGHPPQHRRQAARPSASRGSASAALSPVSTSRKRRAVTGGKATVRTGTALAAGTTSSAARRRRGSRRRRRSPRARRRGGGAAPKPRGAGQSDGDRGRRSPARRRPARSTRSTGRPGRGAATPRRRSHRRPGTDQSSSGAEAATDAGTQHARHLRRRGRRRRPSPARTGARRVGAPPRAVLVRARRRRAAGAAAASTGPAALDRASPTRRPSSWRRRARPTARPPRSSRREVATANSRPEPLRRRRSASRTASRHSGEPCRTRSGTTSGVPIPPSNIWTPRTPTRCSHSRSSRMPSGSTLPSIQCHHARGRASSGGSQNPRQSASRSTGSSSVATAVRPWRRAGRARRPRAVPPVSGGPARAAGAPGAKTWSTANCTAPITPAISMSTADGSILRSWVAAGSARR